MALGDRFPTNLINTTNLRIDRPGFVDDFGDESGSRSQIAVDLSAIVAPASNRMDRDASSEQFSLRATVILNPATAPSDIQRRDVVAWTDFYGDLTEAEVIEVQRFSGVPGLESVVLMVGKR